jgi:large conductance mechanosensitive channel
MTRIVVGFRDFILRGNVVDLAVAVVIGLAFGAVVTSMVEDLFTPLIGAVIGEPDFSGLTFTINGSVFYYGNFLNSLISFLSIAAVVYFLVILPMNTFFARAATKKQCPECLSEIPIAAKRCAFCTAQLTT